MAGLFRFYDPFFYNLGESVFDLSADTLKLALLSDTYIPCPTYGARAGLLNYAQGDVVFETAYNCFFVCSVGGLSSLGAPLFEVTPGAETVDGAVTWVSCGLAPPSAHEVLADVSGSEITGAGYTAGGATASHTHTLAGRRAVLTVPEVLWSASTITAKYGVLYKSGTVGSLTNPLVGYILLDSTNGFSLNDDNGAFLGRFGNDLVYKLGGW